MERLIVCMKWGTRYGAEYANRLYRSCRRHMSAPMRFVCFTDDTSGLDAGIDARPLPAFEDVPAHLTFTPWRKLSLWQAAMPADLLGRDALFLDLDVVVVGPLDDFFAYQPGKYAVIENWTKSGQGIGNTSVFRFQIGKYPFLYDYFMRDPEAVFRNEFRIEQEYISARIGVGEQVYWPATWCRSFKEELLPGWPQRFWRMAELPPDARVIVFHGKPDPDEARDGVWPAPPWKKIYKTLRPVSWIRDNWR